MKRLISNMEGSAALPRKNGELIFASPWESKVFGMAVTLHEMGLYDWEEFRRILVAEIAAWESHSKDGMKWSYYERWLSSLESLLTRKGVISKKELGRRATEFQRGLRDEHHRR